MATASEGSLKHEEVAEKGKKWSQQVLFQLRTFQAKEHSYGHTLRTKVFSSKIANPALRTSKKPIHLEHRSYQGRW